MRKIFSKAMSALVFAILGFLLINRFIDYWKHHTVVIDNSSRNQLSIVSEIEQLKQEKDAANKENSDFLAKIKSYEEKASATSQYASSVKEELERNKKLLGMTDVTGEGIVLYLAPKSKIFNNMDSMDETDVVYLINELYYASAEAISINDIRVTAQSVIEMSDNARLRVNDSLVPLNELVTIKAIGNPDTMEYDLNHYNTLASGHLPAYTATVKKVKDILIPHYSLPLSTDGLKNDEKNK
ncbi:MAG: DUF881 domain-containing protein [Bacillota bacterium]|nr:DUF881 domain-containing protein [Bacillota bacterium]